MNNRITLSRVFLPSQIAKCLIVGSVLTLGLFVSLFAGSDPVPHPEKDVPALPEVKLYDIEIWWWEFGRIVEANHGEQ